MIRKLIFILTLCISLDARLPDLDGDDVRTKISEISQLHATYKTFNEELLSRTFRTTIETLDPTKSYFVKSDIITWLEPSPELLSKALKNYNSGDFSTFEEIFSTMEKAIIRRRAIIANGIDTITLQENQPPPSFNDLDWPLDEAALTARIALIRAYQIRAAELFDEDQRERALARLDKRNLAHEEEILNTDDAERRRYFFTIILKACASSFDTHTTYFTPSEAEQFLINIQQRLFGVGVQIRDDLNGFTIVDIIDGGPAARAHTLKINDRIIAIGSEPVIGMSIEELVGLIRGKKGTNVIITVMRDNGETTDVTITRDEVVVADARLESSSEPFGDGIIGIVKLHTFYQDPRFSSADDLASAITDFKRSHNLKGIILDLRYNAGGMLSQAVAVSGLFITQGIVVSVKDDEGTVQHLRDFNGMTAWDGPLIIVTDRLSASASEIVAQTLQDYGRAIVVGDDHTFGKGSFQTFTLDGAGHSISKEGEYKVTRGKYYTVSGKSPQLSGVIPDIVIKGIFAASDVGERYTPYPLANDSINPAFNDNMEDLPYLQRKKLTMLYGYKLQKKIDLYTNHLPILSKNSAQRLDKNDRYKKFLTLIEGEKPDKDDIYDDFQLNEATNIMKDLILLSSKS